MRFFKNNILTLPVPSCAECPNRKAERIKTAKGFRSVFICSAITRSSFRLIAPENTLGEFHPAIGESRFYGGFLPDCPLESSDFLESSEQGEHGLQESSSARLDSRKPHPSATPPRHSGLDPESSPSLASSERSEHGRQEPPPTHTPTRHSGLDPESKTP